VFRSSVLPLVAAMSQGSHISPRWRDVGYTSMGKRGCMTGVDVIPYSDSHIRP
jgi:hypothetical protein